MCFCLAPLRLFTIYLPSQSKQNSKLLSYRFYLLDSYPTLHPHALILWLPDLVTPLILHPTHSPNCFFTAAKYPRTTPLATPMDPTLWVPQKIHRDARGSWNTGGHLRPSICHTPHRLHVQGGSVLTLKWATFLSLLKSLVSYLCTAGFFTAAVLKIKYHGESLWNRKW